MLHIHAWKHNITVNIAPGENNREEGKSFHGIHVICFLHVINLGGPSSKFMIISLQGAQLDFVGHQTSQYSLCITVT